MIFSLEATIDELNGLSAVEGETLFSLLVDCDRGGRHFFVASRSICDWALENVTLSGRDRSHLIALRQSYTQRGAFPELATFHVKIVIGDEGVIPYPDGVFRVGHRKLIAGEFCQTKTAFVLEDIGDDLDLYRHILVEARKQTNVPSFAFNPIHGGGASTPRVFENEVVSNRVTVCVVDNDKLAPCDSNSGTARTVLGFFMRRNRDHASPAEPFIGIACTTVGRELENYVPYCVLKSIPEYNSYGCRAALDAAVSENCQVDLSDCFWLHFDIKDGLDGAKLVKKVASGQLSEDSLRWICSRFGCEVEEAATLSIDGFGPGVVQNFLGDKNALRTFHQFTRSQYWRDLFLAHFEDLLWFFAAPLSDRL